MNNQFWQTQHYNWEKAHKAIFILAGEGTQSQRLIDAFCSEFIHIKKEGLSEEMIQKYEELDDKITCKAKDRPNSRVEITVNQMNNQEITECVGLIFEIYDYIMSIYCKK